MSKGKKLSLDYVNSNLMRILDTTCKYFTKNIIKFFFFYVQAVKHSDKVGEISLSW